MAHITKFRPSKTPGLLQCPGYIMEPDRSYRLLESDKEMEFASLGSCLHEIFKDFVIKNIQTSAEVIAPYCEKWGVPWDGFMGVARKLKIMEEKWQKNMAQFFTNPLCEHNIGYMMSNGVNNIGTIDLHQLCGDYAIVLDLKTGMTDLDYMAQLKDYALILYRIYEPQGLRSVYCYLWNPIIESYIGKEYSGPELEAFEKELMEQIAEVGKVYKTGPWCGYCDNLELCPHHRKSFLQMEDKVKSITVDQIASVRPIVQAMQKICDMYDETEKALLTKYGHIDLGNGHELCYRSECRRGFDAPKTVAILKNAFGVTNELIGPRLTISKSGIEEIAEAIAPPRGKGKTIKAVMEALAEGEAVKEKYIQKRAVKRISTKEVTDGE